MKNRWIRMMSLTAALALLAVLPSGCGQAPQTEDSSVVSEDRSMGNSSESVSPKATIDADPLIPVASDTIENFNITGYPIVNQPITLKVMFQANALCGDLNEMKVFKAAEELTNIKMEIDYYTEVSAWDTAKNLAFVSGDLPDIFLSANLSSDDEIKYGQTGYLRPLGELVEEYAPFVTKGFADFPDYLKAVTALDGNIYSLGNVNKGTSRASAILYINETWLGRVGMELPTTTDEFYEVLRAFQTGDPDGDGDPTNTIPLSCVGTSMLFQTILPAFGDPGGGTWRLVDDEVSYSPALDSYRHCLEYLNKLYAEKLLDNEFLTQSNAELYAKGQDGTAAGILTVTPASMIKTNPENQYDTYSILQPMTSEYCSTKWAKDTDIYNMGSFAITSSCQYPEAAIRWADLWHRDREHIVNGLYGESWLRGVLGEDWWWTDEEETRFAMAEDPTGELSQSNYRYKYISPAGNGTRIGDTSGIIWDEYFQVLKATQSELNHFPFTVNGYPSTARYTAEEQERLNILQANLDSYVAQMTAKFITGEEKIAEKWDVYVAELKAIGYEELTQIKQAAYDRWNQN